MREQSLSERLPEPIFNAIHQAMGEASMCWDETPKGVFDSDAASKIAFNLCHLVADWQEQSNPCP